MGQDGKDNPEQNGTPRLDWITIVSRRWLPGSCTPMVESLNPNNGNPFQSRAGDGDTVPGRGERHATQRRNDATMHY